MTFSTTKKEAAHSYDHHVLLGPGEMMCKRSCAFAEKKPNY